MRVIAVIYLVFLVGCGTTPKNYQLKIEQRNSDIVETCKKLDCRGSTTIDLKTDGTDFYDEFPAFWPVVEQGSISILPGEHLFIEAEVEGGQIVELRHVDDNLNPEKTFEFTFEQNEKDIGMILIVKNPFDEVVKFRMDMMDFSGNLNITSSCPIFSKAAIVESWPHPIVQLLINDPVFMTDSENIMCEY